MKKTRVSQHERTTGTGKRTRVKEYERSDRDRSAPEKKEIDFNQLMNQQKQEGKKSADDAGEGDARVRIIKSGSEGYVGEGKKEYDNTKGEKNPVKRTRKVRGAAIEGGRSNIRDQTEKEKDREVEEKKSTTKV